MRYDFTYKHKMNKDRDKSGSKPFSYFPKGGQNPAMCIFNVETKEQHRTK